MILVGATGVGKSFIGCALAHQACRKGYRAGYRRASRLFHELTLARADGTYVRLLGKLARLDVLLIDDWGLAPVQDQERRDLLEILEDRYGTRSTIITSQLPPAQWHDYLADATLADAICDRLLHNAHRIVLQGPSRRKEAKLKLPQACLEAIDYPARRELDKAVMRQLATCRWIEEHQQVLITGATGTGKSFVACALAHHACRRGYRAYYRRASRLFDDLKLARADGSYGQLLGKLARMDVLVLDDWGLAPVQDQERRDLLEILEDRYGSRSTIVTSQLPPGQWHDHVGEPTLADAICDRLLHNAHRLVLKGPSRRKEGKLDS